MAAEALNSIFQQWDTQSAALWNISGEPCTGSAISGSGFEETANNPAITCDCTYNNSTTCHITQLRVYALNRRGVIPEELTALTYLTFLKIDQNYFTGPLPSFIGNLSKLQLLSLAHNALSGTIPMELGNLKELTVLSLSSNNFSGTLPPELGNLVNLRELYINSLGVGGEIPSTFANLRTCKSCGHQTVHSVERYQTSLGTGPSLHLCKLSKTFLFLFKIEQTSHPHSREMVSDEKSLKWSCRRFQGNSFEGPIPSSFSKLTSLSSLRISDLFNVSSSLDFIKDLKNLTDFSEECINHWKYSSYIGEFQSLQRLDLSFNNLTGGIPSSLFNLGSLANL
ncbi:putative LRR receptor-like serine/threonine-protein kinase [Vitis vinifera]|uniref:Putative LRR receptor-like serine/threonine-protein kinase n=1 Tax=Vitis vinifera TaxID=29760 RepID=A0A438E781_VITVI|nr:putative LRR receptor-like serine/threonine-protein kinase [Vitis vinifera]